jgi:hypothetical protein
LEKHNFNGEKFKAYQTTVGGAEKLKLYYIVLPNKFKKFNTTSALPKTEKNIYVVRMEQPINRKSVSPEGNEEIKNP